MAKWEYCDLGMGWGNLNPKTFPRPKLYTAPSVHAVIELGAKRMGAVQYHTKTGSVWYADKGKRPVMTAALARLGRELEAAEHA